ncbi:hypothetical protein PROFUN_11331 [Planoprotostelium fungivorum]|uniref:Uncharacterized protein n=1 Tax=Planoprotostelium fungivorum TaxID=1890364 RepID=A0A2P6NAC4_9EUKA|nr:hypothetical protein PROFUN_11331 [Planoprotostelium fungivorum]
MPERVLVRPTPRGRTSSPSLPIDNSNGILSTLRQTKDKVVRSISSGVQTIIEKTREVSQLARDKLRESSVSIARFVLDLQRKFGLGVSTITGANTSRITGPTSNTAISQQHPEATAAVQSQLKETPTGEEMVDISQDLPVRPLEDIVGSDQSFAADIKSARKQVFNARKSNQ